MVLFSLSHTKAVKERRLKLRWIESAYKPVCVCAPLNVDYSFRDVNVKNTSFRMVI